MTKGQGNKETSHPLNKTSMNMLIGSHEKKTKQESSRFYLELRYFALGYSALKKEKKKKKKENCRLLFHSYRIMLRTT